MRRTDRNRRTTQRRPLARALAVLVLLVVIALATVAARHLMPPPASPATPAMRAANAQLMAHPTTPTIAPSVPKAPKTRRERLLATAFALRGAPYKWGAKGPNAYDCSGFASAVYAAAGVQLPNGSFKQAEGEQPLASEDQLTPGDLLLYRWAKRTKVEHVTVYAGSGWVIGTGTPGQPPKVTVYPLAADLRADGRAITFRHVRLADEH
jgi:cell wall-associated NlpC family hydrolase